MDSRLVTAIGNTRIQSQAGELVRLSLAALEDLKNRLLEKETVDADEVAEVLASTKMPPSAALY